MGSDECSEFCGDRVAALDAQTHRPTADTGVSNMPAPYSGGCECGSVRYVVTTELSRLAACDCEECQRQAGSALAVSMALKKDSLNVTGPTRQYTRVNNSGDAVTDVFCPKCGIRLFHVLNSAPDVFVIQLSNLDNTNRTRPAFLN
jgi:hypothetical protein